MTPLRRLLDRLSRNSGVGQLAGIAGGGFLLLWLVLTLGAREPSTGRSGRHAHADQRRRDGPGQQVNPVDQWSAPPPQAVAVRAERDAQEQDQQGPQGFERRRCSASPTSSSACKSQAARPQPEAPVAPPPRAVAGEAGPATAGRRAALPGRRWPRRPAARGPRRRRPRRPSRPWSASLWPTPAALPRLRRRQDERAGGAAGDGRLLPAGELHARHPARASSAHRRAEPVEPQPVLIASRQLGPAQPLPRRVPRVLRDRRRLRDIGSERAYLRTENLSCVRATGPRSRSASRVRLRRGRQVGMRGRLVTSRARCSPTRCAPGSSPASARPSPATTHRLDVGLRHGGDHHRHRRAARRRRHRRRPRARPAGRVLHQARRADLPVIEVDAAARSTSSSQGRQDRRARPRRRRPAAGAERAPGAVRSLKVADDEER